MQNGRATSDEARRGGRARHAARRAPRADATAHAPRPASRQPPGPEEAHKEAYDDGYLRVEHGNYYVACGGQSVKLPRAEFLLLSRLARSPERVVPADGLWRSVWDDSKPLNHASLYVYVNRLRNKFAPFGVGIETMIGVGYRLMPAKPEGRTGPG
jgi:DNA-binding response OmpR family regulator